MSRILVVAETDGGKLREASLELVTLAKQLADEGGGEAVAAVLGASPEGAAQQLSERGGLKVLAVTDPRLAEYTADGWTSALAKVVKDSEVGLVLATHGAIGWDWAPRLAMRLDGGMASECVAIGHEDGQLTFTKKVFNAKLDMRFRVKGSPVVATLQRGAVAGWAGGGDGSVETVAAGLTDADLRGRFGGRKESAGGKVDLSSADIIVAGGRSLGGAEKFDIIEALAEALGGQVGASRPVTDSGWLPPEHQVGSSGVTVSPKLYVACGISGAIQHVVGMKASDFIVAINKDPQAPIFEVADVGVVGDLFELVPALTEAVKEAKG